MDKCNYCNTELALGNSYSIITITDKMRPSSESRYHPWCCKVKQLHEDMDTQFKALEAKLEALNNEKNATSPEIDTKDD